MKGRKPMRRFLQRSEKDTGGLNYVVAVEIEKQMDFRYIGENNPQD